MTSLGPDTSRFAARIRRPVLDRLRGRARLASVSQGRLAERYIDEGMRMDDHPGIVFRDGPMGRRAGLAAGPDVWEIVGAARESRGQGQKVVERLSELVDLTEGQIRAALRYYGEFPDEVEELIERNREEAERAEAAWRRQKSLLG